MTLGFHTPNLTTMNPKNTNKVKTSRYLSTHSTFVEGCETYVSSMLTFLQLYFSIIPPAFLVF